ncbi:MAG: 6-phosphofructokinase [Deltaproteobacteria bacterium]|nr:6-phosphofructokinase [Deltaproteobacteria bacterium]MCL5792852.1 6-phosphofructokinase [Deltaproteobacteria bacterium]
MRIGIITSGGDSPGMNAALRASVRTGLSYGFEMIGIHRGFSGLLQEAFQTLDSKSVSGILQFGGTILQTARSKEFYEEQGRLRAVEIITKNNIDALVIIGGNGSLTGALKLDELGIATVGIPASIDNDMYGTDMAIGVDTALNTIIQVIDKIKDTASSHERAFIIEVMGRESGYLATMSAIASGAEIVIVPEVPYDIKDISVRLKKRYDEQRSNSIIIVAEGAVSAFQIEKELKDEIGFEIRVTVLGHIQRGGSPSIFDRLIASRFGYHSINFLKQGGKGKMVGLVKDEITFTPYKDVISKQIPFNAELIHIMELLGT